MSSLQLTPRPDRAIKNRASAAVPPGRPREVRIGSIDASRRASPGHQPEYRVGARERLVDDMDIAVRSLHDLNALPCLRGARVRTRSRGWVRRCRGRSPGLGGRLCPRTDDDHNLLSWFVS